MNAGIFLSQAEQMPWGNLRDLTGLKPFIVVAPHPDDETLGCAGLLCAAASAGVECRVVIVTDGAASHPRSLTHPSHVLRDLRRAESLAAAALCGLGPDTVQFLDLPDSRMPGDDGLAAQAEDAIDAIARSIGAKALFVTWAHDPHGDHKAVAAVVQKVARARGTQPWSYPIWGWTLPEGTRLVAPAAEGFRLDIVPWVDTKRRAIACHASQTTTMIADDPDGFMLTPHVLQRFYRPYEVFIREAV